jgi:hypothetical protein
MLIQGQVTVFQWLVYIKYGGPRLARWVTLQHYFGIALLKGCWLLVYMLMIPTVWSTNVLLPFHTWLMCGASLILKKSLFSLFFLQNDHSGNIEGLGWEFWLIGAGKWCYEVRCTWYYSAEFLWVIFGTKRNATCGKTIWEHWIHVLLCSMFKSWP